RWPPADDGSRALLLRAFVDVAADALELLAAHDRAHVARLVERVADLHLRKLRGQPLEERVEDALVHEEARSHGARLALARETHPGDDAGRGLVAVGVGEHDLRALASELDGDGQDAVGRETEDRLSGLGVSGERD